MKIRCLIRLKWGIIEDWLIGCENDLKDSGWEGVVGGKDGDESWQMANTKTRIILYIIFEKNPSERERDKNNLILIYFSLILFVLVAGRICKF